MSRTGARDKARKQLSETLKVLGDCALLLGKSRMLMKHVNTPDAAQYLAELDAFYNRPFLATAKANGQMERHL
ncbi:hypothetical protein IFU20_08285 [Pseudomonas viridiflava]|uniref:hypothetical protein n=1 Tax=Pseudomonas viridiflava TaxID=33069 RepID=UPI00177B494B|nr:hypothetical protein [Pseudomonas viridiflava]MBD8186173.1 hypothetical protein [Pseudomonas viridiflava]